MTNDRMGGAVLIAGMVGGIITMILHPTAHDLLSAGGGFAHVAAVVTGVHMLAIASLPVCFLGGLILSRRLSVISGMQLPAAAIVMYGFALVAAMNAGIASGFLAPVIAAKMVGGGNAGDGWRMAFDYTGRVNQAFAAVYVAASSLAIVLWSASMLRGRQLGRVAAIYGCILAPITIAAVLSGHLKLGVHGFGMVVLTQAIWFVSGGVLLWQRNEN